MNTPTDKTKIRSHVIKRLKRQQSKRNTLLSEKKQKSTEREREGDKKVPGEGMLAVGEEGEMINVKKNRGMGENLKRRIRLGSDRILIKRVE